MRYQSFIVIFISGDYSRKMQKGGGVFYLSILLYS